MFQIGILSVSSLDMVLACILAKKIAEILQF
jgi:hypothetical protein